MQQPGTRTEPPHPADGPPCDPSEGECPLDPAIPVDEDWDFAQQAASSYEAAQRECWEAFAADWYAE